MLAESMFSSINSKDEIIDTEERGEGGCKNLHLEYIISSLGMQVIVTYIHSWYNTVAYWVTN